MITTNALGTDLIISKILPDHVTMEMITTKLANEFLK